MAAITCDKRTKAQGNICNRTDMKETHEFYKFLFFPITVCMSNGLCLHVHHDPSIRCCHVEGLGPWTWRNVPNKSCCCSRCGRTSMYSKVHIHNNYCIHIYIYMYLRFLTVYVSPDMKSFFPFANACAQAIARQKMILRCLVVFSFFSSKSCHSLIISIFRNMVLRCCLGHMAEMTLRGRPRDALSTTTQAGLMVKFEVGNGEV